MAEPEIKENENQDNTVNAGLDFAGVGGNPRTTTTVKGIDGKPVERTTTSEKFDASSVGFLDKMQKGFSGRPDAVTKVQRTYETFKVPFSSIDISGISDQVDRKVFTDFRKVVPYVKLSDALNFDNPKTKDRIMNYKGFYRIKNPDKDTENFVPFPVNSTFEQRVNAINLGKGTHFAKIMPSKDSSVTQHRPVKIPYEKALAKFLKPPEGMSEPTKFYDAIPFVGGEPIAATIQEFTGLPLDETTSKIQYVKKLNELLIKRGVDTRTRLGIIRYRMKDTDSVLDGILEPAFNDYANIKGRTRRTIRSVIEFPNFILSEAFDAVNQEYDTGYSLFGKIKDPIPENVGLGPIRENSIDRQEYFERILPNQASIIQDHFASMGLDIDMATSVDLAADFSNLPTRTLAIASEILIPAGIQGKLLALGGKKEVQNFRRWAEGETYQDLGGGFKVGRKGALDMDELLVKWQEIRETQVFGSDLFSTAFELPIVGTIGKKINSLMTGTKLQAGFQLDDAAGRLGKDPEIVSLVNARVNSRKDYQRYLSQRQGKQLTVVEEKELLKLEKAFETTSRDLHAGLVSKNIPKFLRDIAGTNQYMIIGASVAGQGTVYATEDTDPVIGEMIGLFTGMFFSVGRQFRGSITALRNRLGPLKQNDFDLATNIAQNINTFDPEFRKALLARVEYFNGLQQELIKAGVDEKVVKRSFARMSGLAVLQTVEEAERLNIKSRDLHKFKNVETLTAIANEQTLLVNELRAASLSMAKMNIVPGSAAENVFSTIQASLKYADARVAKLNLDIDTLKKYLPNMLMSDIKGTNKVYQSLGNETRTDITSALDDIYKHSTSSDIRKSSSLDLDNHNTGVKRSIANATTTAIKKINGLFSLADAKKYSKASTKGGGFKINNSSNYKRGGHFLAANLENNRAFEYSVVSKNYQILDNANFTDKAGTIVGKNAKADGGDLFSEMLTILDGDESQLFKEISEHAIPQTKQGKLIKAMNGVADDTLQTIFENQPPGSIKNIDELVTNILDSAPDGLVNTNLPRKLQAIMVARQAGIDSGFNVSTLPLNFDQLKEMRSSISRLLYTAKNSNATNSGELVAQYTRMLNGVNKKFGEFKVNLGKPNEIDVGNLYLNVDGVQTTAADLLIDANNKYTRYKQRFFDNDVISNMLGLGIKDGRKKHDMNANFPLGVQYKNDPITWLDFNKIAKMDKNNGLVFNRKFNQGFGSMQANNVEVVDIDTDHGKAVKASLELNFGEWVTEKYQDGVLDWNEFESALVKISQNLTGINADGKKVALINVDKILKDKVKYSPRNVRKDVFDAGENRVKNFVDGKSTKAVNQAVSLRDDMQDTRNYLAQFSANKKDSKSILSSLLDGGNSRLNDIKNNLKKTGRSDKQIDMVLEELLLDELDTTVFRKTGRMDVGTDKSTLITEYDMDVEQLKELIGYNNGSRKTMVEKILGKEKFEFYESMIEFMANESSRVMAKTNLTGVPRNFSIESYISRFYSINRGVISARYVGTEAVLQQFRLKNHSVFKAMLSDKEVGDLFIKMVKSGKPLDAGDEARLFNGLANALVKYSSMYGNKPEQKIRLNDNYEVNFREYGLSGREQITSAYTDPNFNLRQSKQTTRRR